jgi:ATP-dependent RNA helicase DeaD
MDFKELGIGKNTLSALDKMDYVTATEVQEKTIPLILSEKEVVVRSQTGTGKTAAFGIGLIENVINDRSKKGLVLAPTRELALQIGEELGAISRNHKIRIIVVYGGAGIGSQISKLRRGFDIIVATPGRLLDHMQRKSVHLGSVKCIVLDEADRMLDMGFKPDIDKILNKADKERQMMLFSATLDKRILGLIKNYMKNPEMIEIGNVGKAEKIDEEQVKLFRREKTDALKDIINENPDEKVIVFVASKRAVEMVCRKLNREGIEARYLHGGKSQKQRERTIDQFKNNVFKVLIATDVAARGIHVEDISIVVNYDQAESMEMHTHRIGRTGRMGKVGKSITFIERDPIPKKDRRNKGRQSSQNGNRNNQDRRRSRVSRKPRKPNRK